jgi:hypothetical protein
MFILEHAASLINLWKLQIGTIFCFRFALPENIL